jgi:hypothetical protein
VRTGVKYSQLSATAWDDLPAYMSLEVEMQTGQWNQWMFEVTGTKGGEPGSPIQSPIGPRNGGPGQPQPGQPAILDGTPAGSTPPAQITPGRPGRPTPRPATPPARPGPIGPASRSGGGAKQ